MKFSIALTLLIGTFPFKSYSISSDTLTELVNVPGLILNSTGIDKMLEGKNTIWKRSTPRLNKVTLVRYENKKRTHVITIDKEKSQKIIGLNITRGQGWGYEFSGNYKKESRGEQVFKFQKINIKNNDFTQGYTCEGLYRDSDSSLIRTDCIFVNQKICKKLSNIEKRITPEKGLQDTIEQCRRSMIELEKINSTSDTDDFLVTEIEMRESVRVLVGKKKLRGCGKKPFYKKRTFSSGVDSLIELSDFKEAKFKYDDCIMDQKFEIEKFKSNTISLLKMGEVMHLCDKMGYLRPKNLNLTEKQIHFTKKSNTK